MSTIIDAKTFHLRIEEMVATKGCTYVEAVLLYRETANTEYETVSSLVKQSPALKAKIQEEAEVVRMVKPQVKKLQF